LEPNVRYPFRWEIFAEDYVFKKGHRLAVVIAGSDPDWTIPDPEQATVSVNLRKSWVSIPFVGGRSHYKKAVK